MITINPNEWHSKPRDKHGHTCPYCGAPCRVHGSHYRIDGDTPQFIYIKRVGNKRVKLHYVKNASNQKGVRHNYPQQLHRPPITDKVLKRIKHATRLLANGLSWKQVAEKLNVSEDRLRNNCSSHRELWDYSFEKASKESIESIKRLENTSEIFENNGKFVRIATETAKKHGISLFQTPADGSQTLSDFLENFYLPSRIGCSQSHISHLRRNIHRLNAFLGKEVTIGELKENDLCRFLMAMLEVNGPVTVNKARGYFLALWRCAYDNDMCERPPRLGLIRRAPEEIDPPEAWTVEELNKLFEAAGKSKGFICDIPAGQWWLSLLLSVYWTACRISAILGTPTSAYDGAGILVRKQKNHRPQYYPLSESCCKVIDATNPSGRELLWPWGQHKRTMWSKMRQIVVRAGIKQPKGSRQLFHRMRRSSLSMCAAIDPAIAQRQAGHADYATTLKHYIDPRISRGKSAVDILPEPVIG